MCRRRSAQIIELIQQFIPHDMRSGAPNKWKVLWLSCALGCPKTGVERLEWDIPLKEIRQGGSQLFRKSLHSRLKRIGDRALKNSAKAFGCAVERVNSTSTSVFFGQHDCDDPLCDSWIGWIGRVKGVVFAEIIDLKEDHMAFDFE